jgi:hypothetical protein
MAAANPLWGVPRINGELRTLGIAISERTVSRLLTRLSLLKSAYVLAPLHLQAPSGRFIAMMSVLISFLLTLRGIAQSRVALHLEVLALRHQLQVVQRSRPRRLRLAKADRWLWASLSRSWSAWQTVLVIVKPQTVIAWQHQGFRLYWT